MPFSIRRWWIVLLALLMVTGSQLSLAAEPAAEVLKLRGTVRAISPVGETRRLRNGDPVFSGERVETTRRAYVSLQFTDGSRFELGPNSEMSVDDYAYDPAAERNSLTAKILKGTFRFVTGLIAKLRPQEMRVEVPVATVGIRGTHVVGKVEGTSAQIILLEPEEADTTGAIEVSNAFGSVVIDEAGFGTDIRVVRELIRMLDVANAAGRDARVYWDIDPHFTLESILPDLRSRILES